MSEYTHEKKTESAFYGALALVLVVLGGVFTLGYFLATQ